jgi:putative DNA primase/helicase
MSARLITLRAHLGGNVTGDRGTFPGPGHSKRDRSLSLYDTGDRIIAHSFAGDDITAIRAHLAPYGVEVGCERELSDEERRAFAALRKKARIEAMEAERQHKQVAKMLWDASEPLQREPVAYLASRSIRSVSPHADLRYLSACPASPYRPDGRASPAMIARVVDPYDTFLGVHITMLPTRFRMMLAHQRGGVVRLSEASQTLAIAEGIETALSYTALTGIPCWAARSATGIEQFNPPNCVTELIIAADGDAPGMAAAKAFLARCKSFVRQIRIDAAPEGKDWNDVLTGRSA